VDELDKHQRILKYLLAISEELGTLVWFNAAWSVMEARNASLS